MVFFRRRSAAFKLTAGVFVGIPTLGVGALAGYVTLRAKTKPPEHTFQPLVKDDGTLVMNDGVIPPPTRFQIFVRLCQLTWYFAPVALLYYFMKWRHFKQWSELVLRAVENAGPAFTKLGQWAVTRSDLFPEELRNVLERLYSEVSVHPFSESKKLIEEELGKPIGEIFTDIQEDTLGSGSIGQVHKAVLKETGETVVIKVMHPGVVDCISKDFWILNKAADLIHRWVPSLEYVDVKYITLDFTCHLAAQLDFRIELEHLELFNEHFKDVNYVEFPKPHFATKSVLVEGWVPGVPATPRFLSTLPDHVRHILAGKGLDTFCKMMLRDNFLHGDMHPGNILVDVTDLNKPQCYMIDVGLCQKLTNEESSTMNSFTAGFTYWDHVMATDAILAMGNQKYLKSKEAFRNDFKALFDVYRPVNEDTEQVVSNILQSCFECCRQHRVAILPQYMSQLWGVLILEGFINSLDPSFNMVRHCAPWLVSEGGMFSYGLVKNICVAGFDRLTESLMKQQLAILTGGGGAPVETEEQIAEKMQGIKRAAA